jgi:hypothetical protein
VSGSLLRRGCITSADSGFYREKRRHMYGFRLGFRELRQERPRAPCSRKRNVPLGAPSVQHQYSRETTGREKGVTWQIPKMRIFTCSSNRFAADASRLSEPLLCGLRMCVPEYVAGRKGVRISSCNMCSKEERLR